MTAATTTATITLAGVTPGPGLVDLVATTGIADVDALAVSVKLSVLRRTVWDGVEDDVRRAEAAKLRRLARTYPAQAGALYATARVVRGRPCAR